MVSTNRTRPTVNAAHVDRSRMALMPEMVRNFFLSRTDYLNRRMDDPRKDINGECGYPENPTVEDYRTWYDREGLATRVVNVYPDECWSVDPELYENYKTRTTAFERAWQGLLDDPNLSPWHYLHRADSLSGIGSFGILLMGLDDGKELYEPVDGIDQYGRATEPRPERKLLYLRVFDQTLVTISNFETDRHSPRYGQAKFYNVIMTDPNLLYTGSTPTVADMTQTKVHWSRVIHFADNCMSSVVFGVPRMKNVLNRLFDLRKILSGSGEMYWRGAMPGWAFETPPELGTDIDRNDEDLNRQFQAFQNGLQRYVAVTGMRARSLAPQISPPTQHVEEQVKAICTSIGVPVRIFQGSEAGHLASTQDVQTWNRRLQRRQKTYINPHVIYPFVDRLIKIGVLPPVQRFYTHWNDLNSVSDETKADIALKKSQALFQYVSGKCETIMPPTEFYTVVMGMTPEEAILLVEAIERNTKLVTEKAWEKKEVATGPQGGGRTGNSSTKKNGRPKGKAPGK